MHGGNIYEDSIEIDFSINVNPQGVSENVKEILIRNMDMIGKYPDIKCSALKESIGRFYDIHRDNIVCGNGASDIIQTICYMLRPKQALITAPSFSGYERALENVGSDISYYELNSKDDFAVDYGFVEMIYKITPELVFISNPNNPNGMTIDKEIGEQIVYACQRVGAHIVIDECFVELTDGGEDNSFKYLLEDAKGLVILRAFTKSYGMPGIRLGYGLCSDKMLAKWIEGYMSEWNVSGIAQAIGKAAIDADNDLYFEGTRTIIRAERDFLRRELINLGMYVYNSESNFILFYDARVLGIPELLKKRGILIRDCSDYRNLGSGYYRVCIRMHEDNERLIDAIAEIIK